MNKFRTIATAIALITLVTALALASPASAHGNRGPAATVFTATNSAAGNEVIAYGSVDGVLAEVGRYPTGGTGSGSGLGSQGAIAGSEHRLLVVNAGSDQLSLFTVRGNGDLVLTDIEATGGSHPISVTVDGDVAYVLNGGDQTVTGFRVRSGQLRMIAGSHQSLPGSGAAQISFDRDGRRLVVTEKAMSTIDVLPVRGGVAGAAVSNASTGITPFGFAIDARNHVIVSNAAGGAPASASVSSYRFVGAAGLEPISAAVADTQSAACWIALSSDGRVAFTTNAGSGTVSSYSLNRNGEISLLQATASLPGTGPVDMSVVGNTLFTLSGGAHTITTATIGGNGELSAGQTVTVPAGVVGLAAI
ncbi:MAG: beta-propeller fold lactonase family protein [Ilumatobacteraceae bacterium]